MIRARISPLASGRSGVEPRTAHYLARVLRLAVGDRFIAFCDTTHREAVAEVVSVAGAAVDIDIAEITPAKVVATVPVMVVQGLAKGDKCDQIVRDATELGATHIVFANTERSVVRLKEGRAEERQRRWQRIAEEAARQCGRADPPAIAGPLSWQDAVNGMSGAKFCLWENATVALREPLLAALETGQALSFAVGPEGGLTEDEVTFAEKTGCLARSLGPFVLRTETVATAVLGAIRIFGKGTAR